MYTFPDDVLQILHKNGWSEDRKIDVEPYKEYYKKTKQPISDIIFDFLSSFGGLKVIVPSRHHPNGFATLFEVNPFKTSGLEVVEGYSKNWIRKPLCEVGIVDSTEIFAMTPQGEFFLMFDDWVYKMGESASETITNICRHRRDILIPEPTSDDE